MTTLTMAEIETKYGEPEFGGRCFFNDGAGHVWQWRKGESGLAGPMTACDESPGLVYAMCLACLLAVGPMDR